MMYKGDRSSGFGPVSKFAFLLEPHEQLPETRKQAEDLAKRVYTWLSKGKRMPDPTTPAPAPAPVVELTGDDLFDRWVKAGFFVRTGKKKSVLHNFDSKLKHARLAFGTLPLSLLGDGQTYRNWVNQQLADGYSLARPQRILATIVRPAVLWGRATGLITGNPFGKYGYTIDLKREPKRTGRIAPDLEYELLDICDLLNHPDHEYKGQVLRDFLELAIDTGQRLDDYLLLTNADVDWQAHELIFKFTKDSPDGARRFPFDPQGRVAAILQRRRFAGKDAPILVRPDGKPVKNFWKAWVHMVCLYAHIPYVATHKGVSKACSEAYQEQQLVPHLTRHETATWWGLLGVSGDASRFLQGHTRHYDTHGIYQHEKLRQAREELAAKVWPRAHERAVPVQPAARQA